MGTPRPAAVITILCVFAALYAAYLGFVLLVSRLLNGLLNGRHD
jgi:hypothetical protein